MSPMELSSVANVSTMRDEGTRQKIGSILRVEYRATTNFICRKIWKTFKKKYGSAKQDKSESQLYIGKDRNLIPVHP